MVAVKSNVNSLIPSLTQLGLAADQVRITPDFRHLDVNANAWGAAPFEEQFMLASVTISMTLVHYDANILEECLRLSMGAPAAFGQLPRAGARLGNNAARFAPGYNFIGLNLSSTVGLRPWRFLHAYLTSPPVEIPLGNERSLTPCTWRAIPYTPDPWQGGLGASGQILFDHGQDS